MQSHSPELPSSWQNQSVSLSAEFDVCPLGVDANRHPDIATTESASINAGLTRVVGMAGYFAGPQVICQRRGGMRCGRLPGDAAGRASAGAES